jgi:hypothetical protein
MANFTGTCKACGAVFEGESRAAVMDAFYMHTKGADTCENPVVAHSIWRHKRTGDEYTVIMLTNEHADAARRDDYPVTVVYSRAWPSGGPVWSRPLSRWHEGFEFVGMAHTE